ncbi:hypothetical protein Lal_00014270 [Lupinus albus]|nr:hypothetical protein Lal_00014270 [Lupinus albus]
MGGARRMHMYGNWRSAAAFRVRIALKLKGLAYEETFIDLDAGDQHKPEFRAINPQGAVPALFDGDGPPLTQSLAILDYLEETKGGQRLLPEDPRAGPGALPGATRRLRYPPALRAARAHLPDGGVRPAEGAHDGLRAPRLRDRAEDPRDAPDLRAGYGPLLPGRRGEPRRPLPREPLGRHGYLRGGHGPLPHREANRRDLPRHPGLRGGASPAPARRAAELTRHRSAPTK